MGRYSAVPDCWCVRATEDSCGSEQSGSRCPVGFLAETEKTTLKFVWSRERLMFLRSTPGMLAGLVQGPQPGVACRRRASRAPAHVCRKEGVAWVPRVRVRRWAVGGLAAPAAERLVVCVWVAEKPCETPLFARPNTRHTAKFEFRVDNG